MHPPCECHLHLPPHSLHRSYAPAVKKPQPRRCSQFCLTTVKPRRRWLQARLSLQLSHSAAWQPKPSPRSPTHLRARHDHHRSLSPCTVYSERRYMLRNASRLILRRSYARSLPIPSSIRVSHIHGFPIPSRPTFSTMSSPQRPILMIPGPTEYSQEVLNKLGEPSSAPSSPTSPHPTTPSIPPSVSHPSLLPSSVARAMCPPSLSRRWAPL